MEDIFDSKIHSRRQADTFSRDKWNKGTVVLRASIF